MTTQKAAERSTDHATFVIERTYDAAPARVFAAWAGAEAKSAWFGAGSPLELDFAVGGSERLAARTSSGDVYTYAALYQDIVAGERIVYTYEMQLNGERISVSLATATFEPVGAGTTRMTYTEQGVFLDGLDNPAQREHGTREHFEALAAALDGGGAEGGSA